MQNAKTIKTEDGWELKSNGFVYKNGLKKGRFLQDHSDEYYYKGEQTVLFDKDLEMISKLIEEYKEFCKPRPEQGSETLFVLCREFKTGRDWHVIELAYTKDKVCANKLLEQHGVIVGGVVTKKPGTSDESRFYIREIALHEMK